jgi:peptidyl-prolyl cis-trans isomerase D
MQISCLTFPGAVVRIYLENYCISKSLGMKSGVNAKASHILIGYEGSQVPNQKKKEQKKLLKYFGK